METKVAPVINTYWVEAPKAAGLRAIFASPGQTAQLRPFKILA